MKKKPIIIILSLIIILLSVVSACSSQPSTETDQPTQSTSEQKIKDLENQIISLLQSQQLSDTQRKEQIAALEAEIKKLKETDSPPKETSTSTVPEATQNFKYTLENGKAVIISIIATEENLTIPAVIDGYQVYSVATEALTSSAVRSITISDGIEKIDWFAFKGCTSLSSVFIPDSVLSIGYGAFDNTSKALTIHCTRD